MKWTKKAPCTCSSMDSNSIKKIHQIIEHIGIAINIARNGKLSPFIRRLLFAFLVNTRRLRWKIVFVWWSVLDWSPFLFATGIHCVFLSKEAILWMKYKHFPILLHFRRCKARAIQSTVDHGKIKFVELCHNHPPDFDF